MTDELETIRTRHEADDKTRQYIGFLDAPTALRAARQAHADRATLLRALTEAQERAERAEEDSNHLKLVCNRIADMLDAMVGKPDAEHVLLIDGEKHTGPVVDWFIGKFLPLLRSLSPNIRRAAQTLKDRKDV